MVFNDVENLIGESEILCCFGLYIINKFNEVINNTSMR